MTRGVRRPGWGAIAAGLVGIALGLLSTRASVSNLDQVVVWSALLSSTLVWATPLTFAAIGGMICERSGVVNIGLEGMMLAGAFFGALGADKFNSWEMGLVCAAVAGGGFALVHAVMAIHLRADQIVSGFAINFLALGVTGYFFIQIYGENGTPGDLPRIPDVNIDALGKVFGQSEPDDLAVVRAADRGAHHALQDTDRAADPLRRGASARRRHASASRYTERAMRQSFSRASLPRSAGPISRSAIWAPSART